MKKECIIIELLKNYIHNQKIILFGCGIRGKKVAQIIKNEKIGLIQCFIDNNVESASELEIPIYKKEYIEKIDINEYKIIICTEDDSTYKEIASSLNNMGLNEYVNYISSEVFRSEVNSNKDNPYENYEISATYAPWLEDLKFMEIFNEIKENTLVDIYRCYELWNLVEQVKDIREGIFLEIGVWRGGTGILISKKVELLEIKEDVYLCDTFCGVVKALEQDEFYNGGEHSDTSEEYVVKLQKKVNVNNIKIMKGIFPDDTKEEIKDKKIRFCHIDVDVYQSGKDIIEYIWDKMVSGGIIVFDDFGFKSCKGITKLVNEISNDNDKIIIKNLNGHAIVVKIK